MWRILRKHGLIPAVLIVGALFYWKLHPSTPKVISVGYRMPPTERALTLPGDIAIRGHGRHPHFRQASFVQSGAVSRQVL